MEARTSPSRKRQRAPPRKKACSNCTRSKVRCDFERPACSRCRSRGQNCEYLVNVGVNAPVHFPFSAITSAQNQPQTRPEQHKETKTELDLRVVYLAPSANAGDIRDRWLRPYILPLTEGEEIPKAYHPFTLQYIARILCTYPRRMLKDGGLPPIIHSVQIAGKEMPRALANCYSLVRMWEQAVPGSEAMAVSIVENEMRRLAEEPPSHHDYEHLATFQAYLIYSIMMYFTPIGGPSVVNDQVMMTLMELAFRTARNGLFCTAELSRSRPNWESWIMASTKRRAILVMYLFSSVYNADHYLPNFVAEELREVYAPESRSLWDAIDREAWTKEYDRHLLDWEDGMLEISELWRSVETSSPQRRKRIERWVQTVDEFGMMIFAVCAHIHGC
ncbi:Zn(II)2Cys6 transcription factor domain-containing protein [Aspergillus glaucus CBS 516.65]|uniref:Zn(2)-C6 fungal-type domain-containing protein n=1 Tax=Aspergillus glaucus CBS 516.65 TaxID=1160497 RepID=A0A1L9VA78_ASPGL|nr:hypothetical protein ASPGLDRAFT_134346 [Aspergillus glaucus CBS 516.65]OJJ80828.1 hypothetical protein ASPGLDRAFT_134346 [Aspergillus glaucus CBS 516.65]